MRNGHLKGHFCLRYRESRCGDSIILPWQEIFSVTRPESSSGLLAIALGFGTRPERARDIHYRSFRRRSLPENRHRGFWTVKVLSILCAKDDTLGHGARESFVLVRERAHFLPSSPRKVNTFYILCIITNAKRSARWRIFGDVTDLPIGSFPGGFSRVRSERNCTLGKYLEIDEVWNLFLRVKTLTWPDFFCRAREINMFLFLFLSLFRSLVRLRTNSMHTKLV